MMISFISYIYIYVYMCVCVRHSASMRVKDFLHAQRVDCFDITWRKFISQCKDLIFCLSYLWGKIDSQKLLRMVKCRNHLISRDLIWIMIIVWNYLQTKSVIISAIRFAVFINSISIEILKIEHSILKLWTLIKNVIESIHKLRYNILLTFLIDRGHAPNGIDHLMMNSLIS